MSLIRRVDCTTYPRGNVSTIRVAITHSDVSDGIEFVPDIGADVTVIDSQHLWSLGLTKYILELPPKLIYYNADGF